MKTSLAILGLSVSVAVAFFVVILAGVAAYQFHDFGPNGGGCVAFRGSTETPTDSIPCGEFFAQQILPFLVGGLGTLVFGAILAHRFRKPKSPDEPVKPGETPISGSGQLRWPT